MTNRFVLLVASPRRASLVNDIETWLRDQEAVPDLNIRVCGTDDGSMLLRMEFTCPRALEQLRATFRPAAERWDLETWRIQSRDRQRILVLASHAEHALQELLALNKRQRLGADIALVASNHNTLRPLAEAYGVPYTYIPWPTATSDPAGAADAAADLMQLIKDLGINLLVLARFMQILPPEICESIDAINLHHGCTQAFPGADPHTQALDRGAKIVCATAHYVTAKLDAGPIITQESLSISSLGQPVPSTSALRIATRAIETQALVKAVEEHCEGNLLIRNGTTIPFPA